ITDFVDLDDIDPEYFDKPYYLAPLKKNAKAYALLREALKRSGKVGVAKVVIRSREYLAAVIPHNNVLVLEILRYPHEIRGTNDLELPGDDLEKQGVTDREVKMAEVLIEGMTSDWNPDQYKDTYRDDLMALIHRKIESGQTEVLDESPVEEPDTDASDKVVDIMSLLKRSVEATQTRVAADRASNVPDDDDDEDRPAKSSKSKSAKAKPAKKAAKPAAKTAASKPKPAKPRARSSKS
ncbi:MAG TPA: Ku protein, partial [Longimicrobium sp.]|nr:Ku protein [Longimicrobium sp.]